MRKLFAGTMLTFLLGAIAIGGAMAWTGTAEGNSNASAGQVSVSIVNYSKTVNKVVPNDAYTHVGTGRIHNSGDIPVGLTGGAVTNISGAGACNNNIEGRVRVSNGAKVGPGQSGGEFLVDLKMDRDAEDSCQNATINYRVVVNVAS